MLFNGRDSHKILTDQTMDQQAAAVQTSNASSSFVKEMQHLDFMKSVFLFLNLHLGVKKKKNLLFMISLSS